MRKYNQYKQVHNKVISNIPSEWSIYKIKWILSALESGGRETGGGSQLEDGVFSIGGEHVSWKGTLDLSNPRFISNEYFSKMNKGKVHKHDILLVKDGATIGKCAFVNDLPFEKVAVNEHVYILRTNKKSSNQFLFYFVQSNQGQEQIKQEIRGSAQGGLSNDIKNEIVIPIPSLPEQQAIVRFLDYKTGQIDSFIANRQKQIELLKEQLRKKTYTALTKGLSNKEFKSTVLPWFPEIPKNWELYKFNAAIKLLHGFQFRDNHFREHGVKVAKITQLKADGSLDLSEASFVEEKFLIQLKDKTIKSGDILMALTGGTIGKIICVEGLQEEVLQNYRVGKFIPKDKRQLNKEYMFWVLSSEFTFAQILFLQRETGQPNIGISDFSKMFLPMPDTLEEQMEITKFILSQKTEADTLISKYQKQIDLMQEYRTSLISQAVTGKIDVREWKPKIKMNLKHAG